MAPVDSETPSRVVERPLGAVEDGVWMPPFLPPPGGNGGRPPDPEPGGGVSNARLAMLMLLSGESMFFGGLIAGFLMLRMSAPAWPPPLQPRLPVGLTAVNTVALLGSSYTLARALRAVRAGDQRGLIRWLGRTALLGTFFLLAQGVEWIRLVRFGLTVSSGAYGTTFYTVIGAHGLHVLGAVTWLTTVLVLAAFGRYGRHDHVGLSACAMYWHFVVAVWPILYVLVYLT